MKKYDKEILEAALADEESIIKELKQIYQQALDDIDDKIAALYGRNDIQNLQSIIYQVEYQKALKTQINAILDQMNTNQFTSISDYLTKCYENGYLGAMYAIHQQGIPIISPINQDQVVKALQTDSKLSKSLYESLGENVNLLKKEIRTQLSRGIANNYSYAKIAEELAANTRIGLNKSIRIARTEGHRIQAQSAMDAAHKAKDKGADIVKQWDATLDGRTRPSHQRLDGQIRELDEPFEVNGMKGMQPGAFGVPHMDINCRCALLQRARWALDEDELETLKERAEFYGLDKTDDFNDFKQKYLKAAENETVELTKEAKNDNSKLNKCENFNELETYLKDTYKISIDDSVKSLNFKPVKETLVGVESVLDEYPDLKNSIKRLRVSNVGVMSCDGTSITYNPEYFKTPSLLKNVCNKQSKIKHWVKNASPQSIGVHEVAHAVENLLVNSNPEYKSRMARITAWNNCTEAEKIVKRAIKNVTNSKVVNWRLINEISTYATDSFSETMAEAFADVYANGDDANPLSKEIKKVTLEVLEEYEGVK